MRKSACLSDDSVILYYVLFLFVLLHYSRPKVQTCNAALHCRIMWSFRWNFAEHSVNLQHEAFWKLCKYCNKTDRVFVMIILFFHFFTFSVRFVFASATSRHSQTFLICRCIAISLDFFRYVLIKSTKKSSNFLQNECKGNIQITPTS